MDYSHEMSINQEVKMKILLHAALMTGNLMLCPVGSFFMSFCRLLIFFKINFFEQFFQEYHLCVKLIGPRSVPTFC